MFTSKTFKGSASRKLYLHYESVFQPVGYNQLLYTFQAWMSGAWEHRRVLTNNTASQNKSLEEFNVET